MYSGHFPSTFVPTSLAFDSLSALAPGNLASIRIKGKFPGVSQRGRRGQDSAGIHWRINHLSVRSWPLAPEKEFYTFNFSCLVVSTVSFYLHFHLLCTKLHTDLKGTEPDNCHAKFVLDFAFLDFFVDFFFLSLWTTFFSTSWSKEIKNSRKKNQNSPKKRSSKAKSITNFA